MPNIHDIEAYRFKNPKPFVLQFDDSGETSEDAKRPVELLALSGEPMESWYWERCIFERSGCTILNGKITIDYNHDPYEILGYVEAASGTPQLILNGFMTPFEKDRASEVVHKSKQGVPYQCSVSLAYENFRYEYIGPGETTEVDGREFEGPITVFREYTVDGVAICPYGTDTKTQTTVFNKHKERNEKTMTKEIEIAKKDGDRAARELMKKFTKKFGDKKACRYFSDGLDEEAANEQYIEEVAVEIEELAADIVEKEKTTEELKATIAELEAKIAELEAAATASSEVVEEQTEMNTRVASAGKFAVSGEKTPVSGDTPETKEPPKKFTPLTPAQQKFAAKFAPKS